MFHSDGCLVAPSNYICHGHRKQSFLAKVCRTHHELEPLHRFKPLPRFQAKALTFVILRQLASIATSRMGLRPCQGGYAAGRLGRRLARSFEAVRAEVPVR